jgi:hypothetical protein
MAQAPRERLLPDNITEQSDHDVAEALFGKAATEELERLAGVESESMTQAYPTSALV